MKNQSHTSLIGTVRSFISQRKTLFSIVAILIALGALIGWEEYRYSQLQKELSLQSKEFSDKFASFASTTAEFQVWLQTLQMKSDSLMNESVALSGAIQNTQNKNNAIEEQVGKVSSTVGSLDKLSKTDPELLQKYSKVYFLNEHYTPSSLTAIAPEFTLIKDTVYQVHSNIANKLDAMLRAAKADGMNLLVSSAYRSFKTQTELKSGYKVTYGAGTANQFSADQGYSEHQLGTTLDFTTAKTGAVLNSFDTTPEHAWLLNNAHKYGFVMSYPKGNAYYVYEPWHWRYVGVDLANRLKSDNKHFYDLDQRVINDYLLLIFN